MVTVSSDFDDGERRAIAAVLWDGFESKMSGLYGPKDSAVAYYADSFAPGALLIARDDHHHILGMAGVRPPTGAFAPTRKDILQRHYADADVERILASTSAEAATSEDGVLSIDVLSVLAGHRSAAWERRSSTPAAIWPEG